MNTCMRALLVALLPVGLAGQTSAAACDYRPSHLIGDGGTGALVTASAMGAGAGVAVKAAGFYTLTHAVTGATMLASTAIGPSAAGTVGIMGGTAGVIGGAAAIVTAPAWIIGAVVVAVGTAGFEGVCHLLDEKITDFDVILPIMRNLAENADPAYFRLVKIGGTDDTIEIWIRTAKGNYETYKVKNLYIVNGVLKHRDWGPNTTIGNIGFALTAPDADG